MMLLFMDHSERMLRYPSNEVEDDCPVPDWMGRLCCVHLWADETEIAKIAMYLANQGCVKGALCGLLHCSKWVIQSPRMLEQMGMLDWAKWPIRTPGLLELVVECFLEKGAVLNDLPIDVNELEYRPLVLSLLAKKSVIYLEGMPAMQFDFEPTFIEVRNAITVLLLQGQTCGIIPLTTVTQIHEVLQSLTPNLPDNFLPLETLYAMTKSRPSLRQLARTKIRRKMAECGKLSRENLKKLPELPQVMIDFVQLDDLGSGNKMEEIMKEMDKIA